MPKPSKERRVAPRAPTTLLVSFREGKSAPNSAGFVRAMNLSEQGMLLEMSDRFQPGDALNFEILLDFESVARVEGTVVWFIRDHEGMNRAGIEFVNLSRAQRKLIRDQIAKLPAY